MKMMMILSRVRVSVKTMMMMKMILSRVRVSVKTKKMMMILSSTHSQVFCSRVEEGLETRSREKHEGKRH